MTKYTFIGQTHYETKQNYTVDFVDYAEAEKFFDSHEYDYEDMMLYKVTQDKKELIMSCSN